MNLLLIAQVAADPISGGAGWVGAGLLGAILSWLTLKHLPDKDKQLKEFIAAKDGQINNIIATKSADYREMLNATTSQIKTVVEHCREESERVTEAFRQEGARVSETFKYEIDRIFGVILKRQEEMQQYQDSHRESQTHTNNKTH